MITTNVDTSDGIANGSTGVLKYISYALKNEIKSAKIAWIDFGCVEIGNKTRLKYKHFTNIETSFNNKTPILTEFRTFKCGSAQVKRMQFPLQPSFAMTIHKSQGGTYEFVVVHLAGLTRQLLYVACTRVTKASGLFLIGTFVPPSAAGDDDVVINEIKRLESDCQLNFQTIFPEDLTNSVFNFGYIKLYKLEYILELESNVNFNLDFLLIKSPIAKFEICNYESCLCMELRNNKFLHLFGKTKSKSTCKIIKDSFFIKINGYSVLISTVNSVNMLSFMLCVENLQKDEKKIIIMGYLELDDQHYKQLLDFFQKNDYEDNNLTTVIKTVSFCFSKNIGNVVHDIYDCYFSKRDFLWFSISQNLSRESIFALKEDDKNCNYMKRKFDSSQSDENKPKKGNLS